MDDKKIINNSVEFVNLIREDPDIASGFKENFQAAWHNMNKMRISLDRRQ